MKRFNLIILASLLLGAAGTLSAEAAVKNVYTNLIFSNEDANRLCPSACGESKWNGHWWQASDEGKGYLNSVCQCVVEQAKPVVDTTPVVSPSAPAVPPVVDPVVKPAAPSSSLADLSDLANIKAAIAKFPVSKQGDAKSLLPAPEADKVNNNTIYYLAIINITPGQLRYSLLNTRDKVLKAIKKKDVTESDNKLILKYANNTSILSPDSAIPVILAPFGLVLVDGHHDVLSSIALGASTVAVYIKDDLSKLSANDFWATAKSKGYVYPFSLDNKYSIPSSFAELKNDPNRYFAAIAAYKCPDPTKPETATGYKYPLWDKIGKDIPFIEFMISDRLMQNGYTFDESIQDSSDEFGGQVEKARAILLNAEPVAGLKLLPQKKAIADYQPPLCSYPNQPADFATQISKILKSTKVGNIKSNLSAIYNIFNQAKNLGFPSKYILETLVEDLSLVQEIKKASKSAQMLMRSILHNIGVQAN